MIKEIIKNAYNENRSFLMENESKEILAKMDINFPEFIIAKSKEEAVKAAEKFGFPVVLKIVSPDIIHKSDCGGVKVNLINKKEVLEGYSEILKNVNKAYKNPKIIGIMVYKMAPKGIAELIIGVSYDEQFGHSILVGFGGVLVELIKDVSIRLIPINDQDIDEMLKELKSYPLLVGYRGTSKTDIESLINLLKKISNLIIKIPNILEIDLNPIMLYEKGLSVLDARMIIETK